MGYHSITQFYKTFKHVENSIGRRRVKGEITSYHNLLRKDDPPRIDNLGPLKEPPVIYRPPGQRYVLMHTVLGTEDLQIVVLPCLTQC